MNVVEVPAKPKERKTARVAAYARVSADKDAAFHSLKAQVDYYKEYVAAHPDWELADIYSDNRISGTIIERPEFQRMLEDCRAGKIDLVVTKSVTRFARNTVVLLETIRELKTLGIDCFFEKEQMHSISPDDELLLTLLAMYAEEEARSASENQKWRVQKKFKKGEPWVGKMLGYRLVNGRLTVVPEEADIVRQIYTDYLSGMGRSAIAKKLMHQGVAPESGNIWSITSILNILSNEKYTGNMILQKTYRPDFRTKKSKRNNGEVKMYRVKHSHEPIITQQTFDAVQAEMKKRRTKYVKQKSNRSNTSKQRLFCGLIRCGNCGYTFWHRRTNAKKYDKDIWTCPRYYHLGKAVCPAQIIPESILIEKTKEILGVDSLNRTLLMQAVQRIIVPEHNRLVYYLTNGDVIETVWKHASRRNSWTPEMRQKAREKTLERYRKEKK